MPGAALFEIPALLVGAGVLATARAQSRVWLALSLPAAAVAAKLSAPGLCASPSALLAFTLAAPFVRQVRAWTLAAPPPPSAKTPGVPFSLAGRAAVALAAAARARRDARS